MSIYTYILGNVVADLEAKSYGGTFITRLQERENYDLQVRYYVWGQNLEMGLYFEVMPNGDLFTANRADAIYLAEFLMWNFGEEYYKENVSHDNDCYWDMSLQQWVGIALDSGAMYTPVEWIGSDADPTYPSSDFHPDDEDMDSMVQSYCDEQQGDICDKGVHPPHPDDVELELDIIDTLDSHERLDGKFDVVELMSDGNVRMVTKDYDPLALPHPLAPEDDAKLTKLDDSDDWDYIPF